MESISDVDDYFDRNSSSFDLRISVDHKLHSNALSHVESMVLNFSPIDVVSLRRSSMVIPNRNRDAMMQMNFQ